MSRKIVAGALRPPGCGRARPAAQGGASCVLAIRCVILIALAGSGVPVAATAQDHNPVDPITREQVAEIDSIFANWSAPDGPGAAVAVVRNGRTVFSRGYGSAQLEYRIEVTPSTPFHVASVSKQFTTFAVALLARDGRLSWEDDVRTHLPELPELGARVTLRHLANHTSGVRDQWELLAMAGWRLDDVITRDQILTLMARQEELNFEPGTEYLYSNMGYSLLAEVVERVSGKGFGTFLEDRVFVPLGMNRTHVHDDHTHVVPGRAYSYRPAGGGAWQNAVLSYANQGATSLFTTAEDLARWIGEMEAPRVGDPGLWDEMRTEAVLAGGDSAGYGLGLSLGGLRGLRTVGHGGADAGFRSQLLHFPDEGLGIVVLGNASSFNAGGSARRVAELLLGDRMEPLPEVAAQGGQQAGGAAETGGSDPAPEPEGPPESYQGTFYSRELDTFYRIEAEGGRLVLTHSRHPDATLEPLGGDRFQGAAWYMRLLEFTRDDEGEVSGFRATGSRVRGLRFERIHDPARGFDDAG
jgi:CubicO group peptidase (beta-lactamase class C family)